MRELDICVIPGDGIGGEVTAAACRVLETVAARAGLRFTFTHRPAGHGSYLESGDPLPEETVETAKRADGVLVGAMDVAAIPAGVRQPIHALRRGLGCYASVRPSRLFPGVPAPTKAEAVDLVVVRELTQGLFGGVEYPVGPDGACAVRVITREASTRVARVAFEQARRRRGKVTAVHKKGEVPVTESVFLSAVAEVAEEFPDVEHETRNVDACAMELVDHPQAFDTIVATNAFGDILSDLSAGLTGGVGLAPSSCVGDRWAYFEPIHGTAPDIAGKGIANPTGAILSAALMLRHLGHPDPAGVVEEAVNGVLADGSPRTPDLGGEATTEEMTGAVCERVAG